MCPLVYGEAQTDAKEADTICLVGLERNRALSSVAV